MSEDITVRDSSEVVDSCPQDARTFSSTDDFLPVESEQLFEFFSHHPHGYISLDKSGRIIQINTAAAELLRAEKSVMAGKKLHSFLSATAGQGLQRHLKRVWQSTQTVTDIIDIITKDKTYHQVTAISKKLALYQTQNAVVLTSWVVSDATQPLDVVLKKQQPYSDLLLQTAHSIVLVLDTDGTVVKVNRFFEELTGYRQEEVVGKNWLQHFIPQREQYRINHLFYTAVGGSATVGNVNSIVIKDGSEKVIEWYDTQLKDGDKALGILALGQDITGIVKAEEAARESEHRLKLIMNALPVMIAHVDVNDRYVFANLAHFKWFPTTDKIAGQHMQQVVGTSAYEKLRPHLQKALKGQQVSGEIAVSIAGEDFIFVVNLIGIQDSSGCICGVYLVMDDVTEFRVTDANMMQSLTQLAHESRVNQLGQMMSEIAHEFNQPLAAIANYSGAALSLHQSNKLQADDLTQILHNILEQVKRISEFIAHLRGFVRKRDVFFVRTNINKLVERVLQLISVDTNNKNIHLGYASSPENTCIAADPIMIEQVLINLIRNSIEVLSAVNDRQPSIVVSSELSDETLTLLVSDNGPGLSLKMVGQIFKPFFSTKEDSMGLGLSICQSIVDLHQGKLWVEQNQGPGVTFYLQLPICQGTQTMMD